jgi:pimeloyl-ACP methyl ester carboxylesterase/lysophospholipase L1-like esterase
VDLIDTYLAVHETAAPIEVCNAGLPSETVSGLSEDGHAGGQFARPVLSERLARTLLQTKPDLVLACYGMNDGIYLPLDDERFRKFQAGIEALHAAVVASGAKIVHVTPPYFDEQKGGHPGYAAVLDRYSAWLLAQRSAGWDVVDVHGPMQSYVQAQRARDSQFALAGDGVHPDALGHWLIARAILAHVGADSAAAAPDVSAFLASLTEGAAVLALVEQRQRLMRDAWLSAIGHQRPGLPTGLPLPEAKAKAEPIAQQIQSLVEPFRGGKSTWQGFDRYDVLSRGRPAIVVVPKKALPGKPWAWRGEFFGAFANADEELVRRGFHLVYLSVPDRFGNPEAVRHWNDFYRELTTVHGFAKKAVLIGLSRGGLYCYNWAIANPDKVACIYADAAVCDFKSWPGGKRKQLGKGDGSEAEWQNLLRAYGFASDQEAIAYRGNPVDQLAALAAARVPLLHVYGDADTVVPWDENTGVLAERYRKLGGSITLIGKPGVGHHPHGLADPAPIVAFVLQHAQ